MNRYEHNQMVKFLDNANKVLSKFEMMDLCNEVCKLNACDVSSNSIWGYANGMYMGAAERRS